MTKKVVVIGGGTGTYTVLSGLKAYPLDLSVIITMADSGGSNRILRDEFGLLPTSDIRQSIVALAADDSNEILRKLFTYRYSQGTGISGMTFGNLFMAALTDILGSQEKAIAETCQLLGVRGQVIPVTYEPSNLVALYDDGKQVLGEHLIDEPETARGNHKIVELSIFPPVQANPIAQQAIAQADLIVLGPGDLYTSIISNLVVSGIAEAIAKFPAQVVYVMNLMTRLGQTTGFSAKDHHDEINRYLGTNRINTTLINNNHNYPKEALDLYTKVNTAPVVDDLNGSAVRTDLLAEQIFSKSSADKLIRSLIRHDPTKLGKALFNLIKS